MTGIALTARLVHVVLGAFWVGAILFVAIFLEPSVRETGPESGKVMGALTRRGFMPVMITVGTVTVLTGIYLLWWLSGGFQPGFMGSLSGVLLSTGGLVGILALGVGLFVSRPALLRMGQVMTRVDQAGGPPSEADQALLAGLRNRLRLGARLAGALLLLAVGLMAVGPHV